MRENIVYWIKKERKYFRSANECCWNIKEIETINKQGQNCRILEDILRDTSFIIRTMRIHFALLNSGATE